jgi:tetratricopeptide (TPR) repeat protein
VAKVHRRLTEVGLEPEEWTPYLLRLLDLPMAPDLLATLSPQAIRARTTEALVRCALQGARQRPLVLEVENLHWIDPSSEEVLTALAERLGGAAVLLLTTFRPGYRPPWLNKSYASQVALSRLSPADSRRVVQAVRGRRPLSETLLQAILAKADGNPFFLEELTRAVVEGNASQGSFAMVPETVQGVLAARIDRLLPAAKRLLQVAAVIGKDVPLAQLRAVAGLPEAVLDEQLAQLQAGEFLYEVFLEDTPAYTFTHALTQEVAYGSLLQERRRALHRRLLEVIEALQPQRLAEQVERLAHHALRGEVWDKAVTYCRQAGTRAHDRAAFREAVAYFEQSLQALVHLHEHGDTRGLALELRLALGGALAQLGEYGRHLALLGEAEALARALDDRARLGRVLVRMARVFRTTGDLDGAMAAGQQALELAATLGESALQVQASHYLGQAYYTSGDFGPAAELLRRNVEEADRESGTPSTVFRIESRAWLARTLSALGAFAEGLRHGEEALCLATREGRGSTPIVVHGYLGHLYLAKGDLEQAIRVFDQGLALCRASGNRDWLRGIVAGLGYASALQGRLAEGHALLEEAISESIRTGGLLGLAYRVAWLSEVYRLAGRSEEAWQHARQSLDLARQQKERGDEALALHQLGAVHAHTDTPNAEQAGTYYQQALTLAEELGMRPLQAHCHLGLGTLYARTGRPEPARAELSTAIELYCTMDMTFWLPQAEAALASLGGEMGE